MASCLTAVRRLEIRSLYERERECLFVSLQLPLPITLTDDYLCRSALNLPRISDERRAIDCDRFAGKIAKASRGRDPLYLFAALQRQLGYPEVPKYKLRDDLVVKFDIIQAKLRELDNRLRLAESELRGSVDLTQFGKPELLKDDEDDKP